MDNKRALQEQQRQRDKQLLEKLVDADQHNMEQDRKKHSQWKQRLVQNKNFVLQQVQQKRDAVQCEMDAREEQLNMDLIRGLEERNLL